jgi:hypothetical protein
MAAPRRFNEIRVHVHLICVGTMLIINANPHKVGRLDAYA